MRAKNKLYETDKNGMSDTIKACEEARQAAPDHLHLKVQMVKLGFGSHATTPELSSITFY
jgi:hypothetical protein